MGNIKKSLPQKIGVFGAIYEIEYVKGLEDDNGEKVDGLHCPDEKKLQIEKDLSHNKKWHTFLHEIGHAIVYMCSLNEADDWNDNFEHQTVEAYAKFNMRFLEIYEKLQIHNIYGCSAEIKSKKREV